MLRMEFRLLLLAGLLTGWSASSAIGQDGYPALYGQPKKIIINPNQGGAPQPIQPKAAPVRGIPAQPGYVYLAAPMYPVPQPNIPAQVGSVYITNQAFAPHEMLWPHTYRAMYPPFYYVVKGRWRARNGRMVQEEHWELQGTEVKIDYCGDVPILSRFRNPSLLFQR